MSARVTRSWARTGRRASSGSSERGRPNSVLGWKIEPVADRDGGLAAGLRGVDGQVAAGVAGPDDEHAVAVQVAALR